MRILRRYDEESERLCCTCPQARERKRELAHKVVFGCVVVVLNHKPDQGQLRDLKLEAQGAVPPRVKTCRGRKRL